ARHLTTACSGRRCAPPLMLSVRRPTYSYPFHTWDSRKPSSSRNSLSSYSPQTASRCRGARFGRDRGVDLIATMRGERWAIEIKYYRTARAQVQLIRAAAGTLLAALRLAQARRGMLVLSSYLTPELKSTLE